jgi:SAM-dependent methyltransferase
MSHSVERHLGVASGSYDETIRRFIPGYETLVGTAVAAVAAASPKLVLDLGAGTGALAERLLAIAPDVVVELWDVDDAMLGVARERLAPFAGRARFVHRSFGEALPACDGVMASLALHHVPTMALKTELYARAHAALRSGGVLANADVTIPTDPAGRRMIYRQWADHLVAGGIAEERAWQHFAEWASEDRYFSLEEELAALRSVGFRAESPWRLGPATVTVATKDEI